MMIRIGRAIVLAALTLVVTSPARAQSSSSLTKDDREFFAWFDALGYTPSLEKLPLVRVWSGSWSQSSGDPDRVPNSFLAFLLDDDGNRFRVLTLSLQERRFTRRPARGDLMEVKLEPVVLDQVARHAIAASKKPNDWSRAADIPGLWRSQLAYAVIARACAERGMERAAHDLLHASRWVIPGNPEPTEFLADLGERIAWSQYAQALTELSAGLDRAAVRDRLQRLAMTFPNTDFSDQARDYAARLDQMVREESERANRATSLASLEGEARTAELIYQLRDEVGFQVTTPGAVYFLSQDWLQITRTGPAQQLADLGYSAAPQLIDALADPSLTRTYYYRNGPRSIVSVREALIEILSRISGIRFDEDDEKWQETQAKAREWWNAFQKQGERQTLIAGTLAGREGQAELLIKGYPDEAAKVLADALAAANDWSVRFHLVRAAGTLRTGAELPILRASLRDADVSVQLEAAKGLAERGLEQETVESLRATWASNLELISSEELAGYLAHLTDSRGLDALGSRWNERTYAARYAVIAALAIDQVQSPNRAKAEDLLANALDDQSVPSRGGYSVGGLVPNPRICDLAARMMAENWNDRYRFDGMASERKRNAQIAEIKRTWRERRAKSAFRKTGALSSSIESDRGSSSVKLNRRNWPV